MHYAFASLLMHAGHGMPVGHVHASDVLTLGGIAFALIGLDWWAARRGW